MSADFFLLLGIGFLAQIVDGALGMAFGVVSNAAMLTIGMAPAQASALVHTAEVVARDFPWYDAAVPEDALQGAARFAQEVGLISGPVAYDQLVPPELRPFWAP